MPMPSPAPTHKPKPDSYWQNHPLAQDPHTLSPDLLRYLHDYVLRFHHKISWDIPVSDQFNIAYAAFLGCWPTALTISDPHSRAAYVNKTMFGHLLHSRFTSTQARYHGQHREINATDMTLLDLDPNLRDDPAPSAFATIPDSSPTPEESISQYEDLQTVVEALPFIQPNQADVIINVLFNHLSLVEIASANRITPQAVSLTCIGAVSALRRHLQRTGVIP